MINITRGNYTNNRWQNDMSGNQLKIENRNEYVIVSLNSNRDIAQNIQRLSLNEQEINEQNIQKEIDKMSQKDMLKFIKDLGLNHFQNLIEVSRNESVSYWKEIDNLEMINFVNQDHLEMLYVLENYFKKFDIEETIRAWNDLETAIRENLYSIITDEVKKIKKEEKIQ